MKQVIGIAASILLAQLAQATPEPDAARQAELRHLVVQDCGACHGAGLKGGLGPSLLPGRLAPFPDDFLAETILEGRSGTAMPPWKRFLAPGEARWIVRRLKEGGFTP